MLALIQSIGTLAHENTAWNIRNSVASSTSMPHTGCSTMRSMASSRRRLLAGSCNTRPSTWRTRTWVAVTSARLGTAHCTLAAGAWAGGSSCSMCATRSAAPLTSTLTAGTTGMPSSADRAGTSMAMPWRRATSIMFSTSSMGRPSARASSTRRRFRRRLVASATHTSRSGRASPLRAPVTTSRVTASSWLTGFRL